MFIFHCLLDVYSVGRSLARLSGILLKATRRCLSAAAGELRWEEHFIKMFRKLQGLDKPAGHPAVRSDRDCTSEGGSVN
ncbi:hypothetical protein NQZ68_036278 [Dissostichus eleginoides]|nr:hypothetical protein NQZ68_036278 [Dissostichus eleginoides]